jgi:hypothetical protein
LIAYLEDSWNCTALFGNGPQTSVGVKQMTKLQVFEVFATWVNIQNPNLLLNGRQLQQQVDQQERYIQTKQWEENTGAGIENESGPQSLYKELEKKCPCYHRVNALLQESNVQWPEEKTVNTKKIIDQKGETFENKKSGLVVENKHGKVIPTGYQTSHGLFD